MPEDHCQLELFEDNSELSLMRKELSFIKQRCEQLKKSMTSKSNQLAKLCLFLQEENAMLKKRLDDLEKAAENTPSIKFDKDDYLLKLFEEAYFTR